MRCQYHAPDGQTCSAEAEYDNWCWWHHPTLAQQETDIKAQLETWAGTGRPLVGFKLAQTDLQGVKLIRSNQNEGLNMAYADLYHANLQHAHLFHINLHGASLMKANCNHANLNCANLEDVNLLGTQLEHAKLEHVYWGKYILQEKQAYAALRKKDKVAAQDYFEQAEEIYRNLYRELDARGCRDIAGYFFHREMIVSRKQLSYASAQYWFSKLVDLFCGYGERPLRVLGFSWSIILVCSLLYAWLGIQHNGEVLSIAPEATWFDHLAYFSNCLYFSIVTFTTLGYGDLSPIGITRLIAACEAFCGSFSIALFVVVFVKKMTR